jgi:catechol 2,3-dioxygenase-like lactoylglutathione lyase family enzyme
MYDCVGAPCQDEAVIDHFGINCADWDKSKAFYDKVLGVLGYSRQMDYQVAIGYGKDGKPDFWIADMNAGDAAGPNREVHFAFQANDTDAVKASTTRRSSRRQITARAAALAGVPPRLLRRVRPRSRRQQRRSGIPRRCARGLDAERLGVLVAQRFPPVRDGVPADHPPTVHAVRGVVQHVEAQMPARGVHRGMVLLTHGLFQRQPAAGVGR